MTGSCFLVLGCESKCGLTQDFSANIPVHTLLRLCVATPILFFFTFDIGAPVTLQLGCLFAFLVVCLLSWLFVCFIFSNKQAIFGEDTC